VGDAASLEDPEPLRPAALEEFEAQPALAHAGVGHDAHDLTVAFADQQPINAASDLWADDDLMTSLVVTNSVSTSAVGRS
jgi:hypothetical protein